MARQTRAATSRITRMVRLRSWVLHHFSCAHESLSRLLKTPLASLLTVAMLAIALALPGGLYMLTQNMLALSGHWEADTQISLYLREDLDEQVARNMIANLQKDHRITKVQFMNRDEALDEFRQMTGFDEALDRLEHNPLPPVILLSPRKDLTADALTELLKELTAMLQIDLVQLDLEWIKRLKGILGLIQRSLLIVAGLLAIAVVLVVGNTIRLEIENRRDEIVITRLFGATHAFIRRPFLYDGIWFGLLGGLLACILIYAALRVLSEPVGRLIELYNSSFQPVYPGLSFIAALTIFAALLGYLGAWTAVSQHLHKIEPE